MRVALSGSSSDKQGTAEDDYSPFALLASSISSEVIHSAAAADAAAALASF